MSFTLRHAPSSKPLLSALCKARTSRTTPGIQTWRIPLSDLVPLAQLRDQTLLHMVPYIAHCFAAIAIMKVAYPAANGGIDFIHYPVKRYNRPTSCRKMGHPVFDGLQGFL